MHAEATLASAGVAAGCTVHALFSDLLPPPAVGGEGGEDGQGVAMQPQGMNAYINLLMQQHHGDAAAAAAAAAAGDEEAPRDGPCEFVVGFVLVSDV